MGQSIPFKKGYYSLIEIQNLPRHGGTACQFARYIEAMLEPSFASPS